MKNTLIVAVIIMTAYTVAGARQLTPDEAIGRISPVAAPKPLSDSPEAPVTVAMTMDDGNGSNTLYVVNRGPGYMILPADDAVKATVLGYGDSGPLDAADIPEGMLWWLQGYSDQIARTIASPAAEASREAPRGARVHRPPAVTGCVATAMSMMMYYYKYPVSGTGSNTYTPYKVGKSVTVDFSDYTFDYSKMLDRYNSSTPDENVTPMAELMLCAGVSVNMDYGTESSGAN